MRSILIKSALSLAGIVLSAGLVETGLRLAHYGEAGRTDFSRITEYDLLLGWRHKRNASYELTTSEYQVTLQYDANGMRGLNPPYSKPQNVSRIVVLGDSYVDGYTSQLRDRVTELLQGNLGPKFEVINLGVLGYSTDQELLLLEQVGWKYQPDMVVLAFYFNDVWGNGSRSLALYNHIIQKPAFVMNAGGNLVLTNVPVPYPKRWLGDRFKLYLLIRNALRRSRSLYSLFVKAGVAGGRLPDDRPMGGVGSADEFAIYQKIETADVKREWTITQALLGRMKQQATERGVRLVVFYAPTRVEVSTQAWSKAHIPPDYDPGKVAARLVEICKAEGIPYIEPSDRFREASERGDNLYYASDPHWTAAGNRLASQILAEYMREVFGGVNKIDRSAQKQGGGGAKWDSR